MTPEDWREELSAELAVRQKRIDLYTDYYNGDHVLDFATPKFQEAFGSLLEAFATNWCQLVVDAAVERLEVQGFKFSGQDDTDEDAWTIWQRNRLDAGSIMAHTEAVRNEASYLCAAPARKGDDTNTPRITVEHPSQVIVAADPTDRMIRLAALKRYRDANGDVVEVVYEPNRITTFRSSAMMKRLEGFGVVVPYSIAGPDSSTTTGNPLGIVPIVPLENNPDLLTGGRSDLKPAIDLNNAANKFFCDMLVASEYAAFPQRVLMGVEIPKDPITKEPIEEAQLRSALSRLWAFENEDAKAFEFSAADLSNYVGAIETAVQHLAAQTRTPPHYLLAKLVNISGEALVAAETGLQARCERKTIDFSDPWEEGIRLAFRWRALSDAANETGSKRDLKRADDMEAETQWANVAQRSPAVLGDALVKKKEVGWPQEALWAEGGMSQQQIRRAKQDRPDLDPDLLTLWKEMGVPNEVIWKHLGFSNGEIADMKSQIEEEHQKALDEQQQQAEQAAANKERPGGDAQSAQPKRSVSGAKPSGKAA